MDSTEFRILVHRFDQVMQKLFEIQAQLTRKETSESPPLELDLPRERVMEIFGFASNEILPFYQFAYRAKLKPYRRKHYRREDVMEARARAGLKRRW